MLSYWIATLKMIVMDRWRELFFWRRPAILREETVLCDDGGEMRLHFFYEEPKEFVVLFIHGLSGSGTDAYAMELIRGAMDLGYDVVSSTRRGCGRLKFKNAKMSHAAAEDDIARLVQHLKCPVVLYAASFGGLLAYRYAAMNGQLKGLVAVCPLLSPLRNNHFLRSTGTLGRIIDSAVASRLQHEFILNEYPSPELSLRKINSVREFDDLLVCPSAGFANADEYYRASDATELPPPKVPCLLISALDDPVVDGSVSLSQPNSCVHHLRTPAGSHCGDPRGFLAQLWTTLRGGRGGGHARLLHNFIQTHIIIIRTSSRADSS